MNSLYLIGFAQALFFAALVLTKKNKALSDYFLSFFILLLAGQLFYVYSKYSGLLESSPWIFILDIYYWVFLGPVLLVYTHLMTKRTQKLEWKYFVYLLPAVIATFGFSEYIFNPGNSSAEPVKN